MATTNDVLPFRALHYDPQSIDDIGLCLSQPYDVISPEMQASYYRQHPCNVVRLILGRRHATDTADDNRYTRAAATLDDWVRRGVLRHTRRPSFWVYEQQFGLPQVGERRVTGFIGLVRLQDYAAGAILPHEKVMRGVVEDRLQLMRASNVQMEYIWSIYQDRAYAIDDVLEGVEPEPPVIDHREQPQGVRHRLWRLTDERRCATISRMMREHPIFIADGHHRYQTMLSFRDRMRRRYPHAGRDAPWEFILMFLVNSEHQGLTILPTHRVLHDLRIGHRRPLEGPIMEHFRVRKYTHTEAGREEATRRWLRDLADAEPGEHKIGAYIRNTGCYYLATLKDAEAYEQLVDLDYSSRWKRLDVNILNVLVLQQILGITEAELDGGTKVSYTKSIDEALAAVDRRSADVALLMNPTRLDDVLEIARAGERMPRKSTYFYPKPVSGLVFYPMGAVPAAAP